MDTTIEAWLHELGARAFDLGLTSGAYLDAQGLTLDCDAAHAVFQGWLHARDSQNGWNVN